MSSVRMLVYFLPFFCDRPTKREVKGRHARLRDCII